MADIYTSSGILTETVLAEFIRQEALEPLAAQVVLANLVAQYDASMTNSRTYQVPTLPSLSASSVGETADLTSTAFQPTSVQITQAEVGLMTIITDTGAQTSVLRDIAGLFGAEAGRAIGRQMDTDIQALHDALNGGTNVGPTGTGMTASDFLAGIYTLEGNNVPGDYVAAFHADQLDSLRVNTATSTNITSRDWAAPKTGPGGFVGNLYGVAVYMSNQLSTVNGATGDRVGVMMGTGANSPIGMAVWRDVRVEMERDASRRGDEVVVTSSYAVAEVRDGAGVSIQTI